MYLRVLKANPYHDREGQFTTKEKDAGRLDVSSWKPRNVKVGSHSNPGGVFEDTRGNLHYVKFPQRNPEQVNAEHLADAIYRELDIPVKDSQIVTKGSQLGLAGKMLPGAKELGKTLVNQSFDVKSGYVADAYLASWDVFGLTYDNILSSGGRDYRVDNGGTLFFRAQGEKKNFPADRVDELESLIAPGKKGHQAFAGLTDQQKTEQAHRLVTKLTDQRLAELVADSDLTGEKAEQYLAALRGRRDVIAKRFGVQKRDKKKPRHKKVFAAATRLVGWQEVPMDLASIDQSLMQTVMKRNPYHDRGGKFTSKDKAVPKGPAESLQEHQTTRTAQEILQETLPDPEERARFEAAEREVVDLHDSGTSSKADHTKPGTGAYTAERLGLHRQIIEKLLGDTENHSPAEGQRPTLIMVGGRTGSGKGNFEAGVGKDLMTVYDPKHYAVLDPDTIKGMLPGYDPARASFYHEESADVFDKALSLAKKRGLNLVLDFTMSSDKTAMVRSFKKLGYDVEAHYVYRPAQKAAVFAIRRWQQPSTVKMLDGSVKTFPHGRIVPTRIVMNQQRNEQYFDRLTRHVDRWSLYDNSSDQHDPKLVARSLARSHQKVAIDCSYVRVLKTNPYHDKEGRFTSKEKAVAPGWYQSHGGHSVQVDQQGLVAGGKHSGKKAIPKLLAAGPFKSKTEVHALFMSPEAKAAALAYGKPLPPSITKLPVASPSKTLTPAAAAAKAGVTPQVMANLAIANPNVYEGQEKLKTVQAGVKSAVKHIGGTNVGGQTVTVNPNTGNVEVKYHHGFYSAEKAQEALQPIKDWYTKNGFTVVEGKPPVWAGDVNLLQKGTRVLVFSLHQPKADPAPPVVSEKAKPHPAVAQMNAEVEAVFKPPTAAQVLAKDKAKSKLLAKYQQQYEEQFVQRTIEALNLKAVGQNSKAKSKLAPLLTLEKGLVQYGITPEAKTALNERLHLQVEQKATEAFEKAVQLNLAYSKAYLAWQLTNSYDSPLYEARVATQQAAKEFNAKNVGLLNKKAINSQFASSGEGAVKAVVDASLGHEKFQALQSIAKQHDDVQQGVAVQAARKLGATPEEVEHALHTAELREVLSQPVKTYATPKEALDYAKQIGVARHLLNHDYEWNWPQEKKEEHQLKTTVAQAKYELAKAAYLKAGGTMEVLAHEDKVAHKEAQSLYYQHQKAKQVAQKQMKQDLQKASHDFLKANFEHGGQSVEFAAADKKLQELKKSAPSVMSTQYDVDAAVLAGKNEWDQTIKQFKDIAVTKVKQAVFEYEYAVLENAPAEKIYELKRMMASSKLSEQKYLPPQEMEQLHQDQKNVAVSQKAINDQIKSLSSNLQERLKDFDSVQNSSPGGAWEFAETEYGGATTKGTQFVNAISHQQIKLTPREKEVRDNYVGSGYTGINKAAGAYAAAGKMPDAYQAANIAALDSAIAKSKLGVNVRLVRSMPQKYLAQAFGMGDSLTHGMKSKSIEELKTLVGRTYTEGAFSSTSMMPDWISSYSGASNVTGRATLRIRAPHYLNGLRIGGSESEVILARGTTYVIRDITRKDNGRVILDVDAVAQLPKLLPGQSMPQSAPKQQPTLTKPSELTYLQKSSISNEAALNMDKGFPKEVAMFKAAETTMGLQWAQQYEEWLKKW